MKMRRRWYSGRGRWSHGYRRSRTEGGDNISSRVLRSYCSVPELAAMTSNVGVDITSAALVYRYLPAHRIDRRFGQRGPGGGCHFIMQRPKHCIETVIGIVTHLTSFYRAQCWTCICIRHAQFTSRHGKYEPDHRITSVAVL
jgi:hypothetical protein